MTIRKEPDMEENKSALTFSAMENALLYGLYAEPESSWLEEIQYRSSVPFSPTNLRKQRIKAKLKRNRLVYGAWLKYKEIRYHRSTNLSVGVRVKSFLKKFRLFRFANNHLRMPGRTRENQEILMSLLEIATSTSQKCDSLCWLMGDLTKRVNTLEAKMNDAGNATLDKLVEIQDELGGTMNMLAAVQSESRAFLTGVYEKLDGLSEEKRELLTGAHEKLDGVYKKLDGLSEENRELLTGVHEKLDNVSLTLLQTKGQLDMCRTVVSTSKVNCVQYDWNLLVGVPSDDWRLAMYLSRGGHFEYGTELLFRKIVKPGMKVLDIGANVGIYTLHGLKCEADVYAFEPTPSTFQILKDNVALNGFENSPQAHLYNYAVSDSAGSVRFAEVEGACGHNNMFTTEGNGACIEVPTIKLDDLLESMVFDCFKMDIEGAEMLALRGMKNLLSVNPDIRGFVEFAPQNLLRANVNPKDYYDFLRELGFVEMYCINEANGDLTPVTSYEQIRDVTSINLFITKGGKE